MIYFLETFNKLLIPFNPIPCLRKHTIHLLRVSFHRRVTTSIKFRLRVAFPSKPLQKSYAFCHFAIQSLHNEILIRIRGDLLARILSSSEVIIIMG